MTEFSGEDAKEFINEITLKAPAEELIPIAIALLTASYEVMTDTTGPVYGAMAAGENLLKGFALLPLGLQHLFAQMAVLAVAISAEDDAPEDFKTPEGYAQALAEHFEKAGGDFGAIRDQFHESMEAVKEVEALEEAFNLPAAAKPETEGTDD